MLNTDLEGGGIVYTTDGTEPDMNSLKYSGPVEINQSLTLKARAFRDGHLMGIPAEQEFHFHKASGRDVMYKHQPNPRFMANAPNILTDGLRGSIMLRPNWHGFQGEDVVATIDLEEVQAINSLTLGTLQRHVDWVFAPQWVKLEISLDGKTYIEAGKTSPPVVNDLPQAVDFFMQFENLEARFLRITARNFGACPSGHPGEGQPAWLFVDEIIVK
ncbi:MAG: FN3 associated domain-containing protein [Bacteroides sp.]|nr:FN3 associated domain-containing protein [Bacteroides sp.]